MRFINTTTLQFREIQNSQLSKLKDGYSILSHRWGEEEILYTDIVNPHSGVETKAGYPKFRDSCALAKRLGYSLLWIDTCCINKTDAVEMGEAINSMFRWYANSKVCIAYLEDVIQASQISQSVWFTRGWTLQELIAPRKVSFYSKRWLPLGDKVSLSKVLVDKTGIPVNVLKDARLLQSCSIAQRMPWAAHRETTRVEDRAYSLMGIFDVNMPMIYGEQEEALVRLQEAIISRSTDESIFAWDLDLLQDEKSYAGLLATSPTCFARCSNIVSTGRSRGFHTNQFGLSITLPAIMTALDTFEATLKAADNSSKGNYAIVLAKLPHGGSYARVESSTGQSKVVTEPSLKPLKKFNVSRDPTEAPIRLFPGFWVRKREFRDLNIIKSTLLSRKLTIDTDRLVLPDRVTGTAGIVQLDLKSQGQESGAGWIVFGFHNACKPACFMTFPPPDSDGVDSSLSKIAFLEAKQAQSGTRSKKNLEHRIFSDDWLQATDSEIARYPPYSYDSRSHLGESDGGLNVSFKAPSFEIFVTINKQPDVRPGSRTAQSNCYVWAVDISVGSKVQRQQRSDERCCC